MFYELHNKVVINIKSNSSLFYEQMEVGAVFYECEVIRSFIRSVLLIYVFDNLSLREEQFYASL